MEIFLRPKAPAHAPASHVAWLIALAATPREGHSRSSLVGSWAGVWRSAKAEGNAAVETTLPFCINMDWRFTALKPFEKGIYGHNRLL